MGTQYLSNMSDLWSNATVDYNSIKMNVTHLASGPASKLIDLQIGNVSKFSISKAGTGTFAGGASFGAPIVASAKDVEFHFIAQADATRRVRLSAEMVAAGQTRVVTVPDEDVILFNAIGAVIDFAGAAAPLGFLMCYGQAVSRATYAKLWSVLGSAYGAGDGSTTFNVPDLRGRVIAGKDDMGGTSANRLTNQSGGLNGDVLGATGGAETHTLTTAQLASHSHSGTTDSAGGHSHTFGVRQGGAVGGTPIASQHWGDATATVSTAAVGAHGHTFTTGAAGSGQAHNNVQPTAVLNKIIFAGA
jgi:microcystin-dependent protein